VAAGVLCHPDYLARRGGAPDRTQLLPGGHHWIGLDRSFDLLAGFRDADVQIDRSFFAQR
jgi:hypothetical protein